MKTVFLTVAALLSIALAQNYGGSSLKSTSTSAASTLIAAADTGSGGRVHMVRVGESGFVFDPDTLMAAPGDIVQFQIAPTHSVARSAFDSPCQPVSGAGTIWTGFSSNDNTFFSITINDTQPLWLYCAAPTHCQMGMSMAIDSPANGNTIAAYQSASSGTNSGTPAEIAGGIFGKVQASASGAVSASGSASTSATLASSTPGAANGMLVDVMMLGSMFAVSAAYAL